MVDQVELFMRWHLYSSPDSEEAFTFGSDFAVERQRVNASTPGRLTGH